MHRISALLALPIVVVAGLAAGRGLAVLVEGRPAYAQSTTQGAALATPWTEIQGSRVRLVAQPDRTGALAIRGGTYVAGVEIALADGWKTYWRMPGDAGVPPTFDWAKSANVAETRVLYPAPHRIVEPAAETVGYKGSVVFPVQVTPKDLRKPVDLKLELEFGLCRDICVPATASLALAIAPAAKAAAQPELATALEQVPRASEALRGGDPKLTRVIARLDGANAGLIVEAKFPGGTEGADAFIEAPDGLYVPLPKRIADAEDGSVRFQADLSRGGNAGDFKGKTLTVTLVSAKGASESSWKIE